MIEFASVTYRYPSGTEALKDINVQIKTGEVVAIVGGNGSGKTTLVRHTNGLLKPTKGRVTVFGVDTRNISIAELSRRVGIVFQNPDHQLFSETVEEEILFGLRNFSQGKKIMDERLEWALEFFDLKEYRFHAPMMLSGGEKKRLCLAAILAWKPDILILDEPTIGQDYVQKEKLQQTIALLKAQGKTVIIVSHDIEFIWLLQPRVMVMVDGQIVADGEATMTFENKEILEKANLVKPQLLELTQKLKLKPEKPFEDVYVASSWLRKMLIGR